MIFPNVRSFMSISKNTDTSAEMLLYIVYEFSPRFRGENFFRGLYFTDFPTGNKLLTVYRNYGILSLSVRLNLLLLGVF